MAENTDSQEKSEVDKFAEPQGRTLTPTQEHLVLTHFMEGIRTRYPEIEFDFNDLMKQSLLDGCYAVIAATQEIPYFIPRKELQFVSSQELYLAKGEYDAYGETTNFKNFLGNEMPKFDELPEDIKVAWVNATQRGIELHLKKCNIISPKINTGESNV